jgi:regulator of protease activity HflC (stomatin/prohibitin superfamily)
MAQDDTIPTGLIIGLLVTVIGTVGLGMWGCPAYNVYSAEMSGKAELAQAEQNRQIQIAQSKAKADAAEFEANAEVTRAEGVAKANKIIGDSLKGNEEYLRYLWVNNIESSKDDTIVYVPTEANMPILEASRLQSLPQH